MGRFCSNCGNEIEAGTNYCSKCGANISGDDSKNVDFNQNRIVGFSERNIATAIILSLFTCGIYNIYWFITLTDEINSLSDEKDTSGGVAFLLSLITCGIYGIYWSYKMGQKLYVAGRQNDKAIGDNGVLYLVLTLFGFGIIAECLMQNDLNKFTR